MCQKLIWSNEIFFLLFVLTDILVSCTHLSLGARLAMSTIVLDMSNIVLDMYLTSIDLSENNVDCPEGRAP